MFTFRTKNSLQYECIGEKFNNFNELNSSKMESFCDYIKNTYDHKISIHKTENQQEESYEILEDKVLKFNVRAEHFSIVIAYNYINNSVFCIPFNNFNEEYIDKSDEPDIEIAMIIKDDLMDIISIIS